MKRYRFETVATMKEYNSKNWWIDHNVIRPVEVEAETIKSALKEYQKIANDKYYVSISNNAINNPSPMFVDSKEGVALQVGYVITGSMDFETDNYQWKKQFINLWVDVKTIENPFRKEV